MTRIYFDDDEINGEPLSANEGEYGEDGKISYKNKTLTLTDTVNLFTGLREYAEKNYYCCLLDRDGAQKAMGNLLKESKQKCTCTYSTIPEHRMETCSHVLSFYNAHKEPLDIMYRMYLKDSCTYNQWVEWAFNNSSECSCREINN
jgi:hypothetical protein